MPTLVQLFHLLSEMESWILMLATIQLVQSKLTITSLIGMKSSSGSRIRPTTCLLAG